MFMTAVVNGQLRDGNAGGGKVPSLTCEFIQVRLSHRTGSLLDSLADTALQSPLQS
jgi:hypothetical protein